MAPEDATYAVKELDDGAQLLFCSSTDRLNTFLSDADMKLLFISGGVDLDMCLEMIKEVYASSRPSDIHIRGAGRGANA